MSLCRAWLLLLLMPFASVAEEGNGPEPVQLKPNDFAYGIPLEVDGDGALYSFDLPLEVYRKTTRDDLTDMRIFNGYNEVVPHLLKRRKSRQEKATETVKLPFFPLYEKLGDDSDTEVHIATDDGGAVVDFWQRTPDEEKESIGRYLIDASILQQPIESLILQWGETEAGIIETVTLERSADLAHWEPVPGHFTLAELSYEGYRLGQHELELSAIEARYLRLSWPLGKQGIELQSIRARVTHQSDEPPREWLKLAPVGDQTRRGDYVFDSGGHLPVDRIRVVLPQVNSVVHAKLYSRASMEEGKWQLRHQGLLYHLEREGHTLQNEAIVIPPGDDRYWRLEADDESGGLGSGEPGLKLGWYPHRLYFVARGETPFSLAFGAAGIEPLEADLTPLMQTLQQSRKGEGFIKSARPGVYHELGGERRLQPAPPPMPWKRWLLWSVLVFGVLMLALMARNLFRQMNDVDRID